MCKAFLGRRHFAVEKLQTQSSGVLRGGAFGACAGNCAVWHQLQPLVLQSLLVCGKTGVRRLFHPSFVLLVLCGTGKFFAVRVSVNAVDALSLLRNVVCCKRVLRRKLSRGFCVRRGFVRSAVSCCADFRASRKHALLFFGGVQLRMQTHAF